MPTKADDPKPTYRNDPYRNFRFRLKWDGQYVAGISKVGALSRASDFPPITLERGVTHDLAFGQWATKVWDCHIITTDGQQARTGNEVCSLMDFRKDIVLETYNEAGQKVLAYTIYRCWPSEFVAMSERDPNGTAVTIVSLTLENEGWECDTSVGETDEPAFLLPAS